jgi:flagellar biosynthesis protein FlhA
VAGLQNDALAKGYAVVDQTSVLATHLAEIIKRHAPELLTRNECKRLLDRLAEGQPKLVEELTPKLLSLGEVQKVLQQLLREQVSIRDLASILEALIDNAVINKNAVLLVEGARALSRALVRPLLTPEGNLRVLALDSSLQEELGRAFNPQAGVSAQTMALQPPLARRILDALRRLVGEQADLVNAVILCPTPARFHLKRLLEPFLPKMTVLSPSEIPPIVRIEAMATLT